MQRPQAFRDLSTILVAAVGLIGVIGAFNYAVDPLQIFHAPWFYTARYASDPRIADAGLIESQAFDTVFMGTSFSYAVRQREIDEALGGKSLKLAISGGTSREQQIILAAALRKNPKRVIWQMDDYMFRDSGDPGAYLNVALYERSPIGLLGYLFGLDTGRESLWIALGQWKPLRRLGYRLNEIGYLKFDRDDPAELNTIRHDADIRAAFNEANARAAFAAYLAKPELATAGFSASMIDNFERDAVELIKGNPYVSFTVYFPPYSILNPLALNVVSPATLETVLRFNQYQLERLSALPNVSVFDFRAVAEITHDLTLYRDTIHYAPQINSQILGFIAAGQYKVNKQQFETTLQQLRAQISRAH